MTSNDSGRGSGRDPLVVVTAACCIAASAGAALGVALWIGAGVRSWIDAGLPLAAGMPATAGAVGLGILALLAFWSMEMARGSHDATRRLALLLLVMTTFLLVTGLSDRSIPLFVAGAVAAGLRVLVGIAGKRLDAEPEPPAVTEHGDPGLTVPPDDLEAATAARPYPYPAPLPPAVKAAHLAASAALQWRINCWTLLVFAGLVPALVPVATPRMWVTGQVLAAVLFLGGVLLVTLGVLGLVSPLRTKYRHMALLRAYGIRLDFNGNYELRSAAAPGSARDPRAGGRTS
jgi:hypothetical protein